MRTPSPAPPSPPACSPGVSRRRTRARPAGSASQRYLGPLLLPPLHLSPGLIPALCPAAPPSLPHPSLPSLPPPLPSPSTDQTFQKQCNGARPSCTSCTSKRTRCFFDPDREGGQVASLRRRHDALAAELHAHRALYAALRAPDPARARDLLPRIRAAADVHDAVDKLGLGLVDAVAELEVEGEGEGDGQEGWSPGGRSVSPRVQGGVVHCAAAAATPSAWDGGAARRERHGALAPLVAPAPVHSVVDSARTGACSLPDIRSFCSGAHYVPWAAAGGVSGGGVAEYVGVAGRWA